MDGIDAAVGGAAGAPQAQMDVDMFDAAMAEFDQQGMNIEVPGGIGSSAAPKPPTDSEVHDPNAKTPEPEQPPEKPEEQAAMQKRAQEEAAELEAFRAWKKSREESLLLPESDHERLINVPWGEGKTRDVPISEMKRGYMRQLDATRKTQAAADMMRQAEQQTGHFNAFLGDLGSNGKTMRERLEDAGFGKQLYEAAQEVYGEILQEEQYIYRMQQAKMRDDDIKFMRERFSRERDGRLQARIDARQRQLLQQQAQNNQQQQAQEREAQELRNAIAQLRPAAFKKLGMKDDALHNDKFGEYLLSDLRIHGGLAGRHLRDVVMAAATSAQQFIEERIAAHQATLAQQDAADGGLQPSRLPGAPPSSRAAPGAPQRAFQKQLGIEEFDAEMERLNRSM